MSQPSEGRSPNGEVANFPLSQIVDDLRMSVVTNVAAKATSLLSRSAALRLKQLLDGSQQRLHKRPLGIDPLGFAMELCAG
jgi:hypothetical protein